MQCFSILNLRRCFKQESFSQNHWAHASNYEHHLTQHSGASDQLLSDCCLHGILRCNPVWHSFCHQQPHRLCHRRKGILVPRRKKERSSPCDSLHRNLCTILLPPKLSVTQTLPQVLPSLDQPGDPQLSPLPQEPPIQHPSC